MQPQQIIAHLIPRILLTTAFVGERVLTTGCSGLGAEAGSKSIQAWPAGIDGDVLVVGATWACTETCFFTPPALLQFRGKVGPSGADWLTWKAGYSFGKFFPALAGLREKMRQWKIAPQAFGQS